LDYKALSAMGGLVGSAENLVNLVNNEILKSNINVLKFPKLLKNHANLMISKNVMVLYLDLLKKIISLYNFIFVMVVWLHQALFLW
jgi:hypothetical protein